MLEFKNPEENIKLKRKLKVLDVERDQNGELRKLYVGDTILEDDTTENLIQLNKENLEKIITTMIHKEYLPPYGVAQLILLELINQIKPIYTSDTDLPVTSMAFCNWELAGDYQGVVLVQGNRLVFNREIYDIEFELQIEVIYEDVHLYKTVKSTLKGLGANSFTNPEDVVYELVKNIPSYLEKDYKLPVLENATWSLVGDEDDAVIEDNLLKIIKQKSVGDNRITLRVEYVKGVSVASAEMYITIGRLYLFDKFNILMERKEGQKSNVFINIESNNNQPLYIVTRGEKENFNIKCENNYTKQFLVEIEDKSSLYNLEKYGTEDFIIIFDIYTDNSKQYLYGTEEVIISYRYGPDYIVGETEAYLIDTDNQLDTVSFLIENMLEVPLYAKIEEDNEYLDINIYENSNGDIEIDVTEKANLNDNYFGPQIDLKFKVGIYLDSNFEKKSGIVEFIVNYIPTSTDPID